MKLVRVRAATSCILLSMLLLAGGCAVGVQQRQPMAVDSPDGKNHFQLLTDQPRLRYAITMNGATVIEPSPLVFTIDGVDILDGATVNESWNSSRDERYPTRGAHAQARSHYNSSRFVLDVAKTKIDCSLDVRAFDDGIAFRLVARGGENQSRVPDEATVFTIPAGATIWSHNLSGHYEGTYEKRGSSEFPAGEWAAPPVTFKLPDGAGYASITEADLVNYSGMALEGDGKRGLVIGLAHRQPVSHPFELRYKKEDIERLSKPAAISGTITTPWRVVMAAKDLNGLVNCDLVTNLCSPPDPRLFPQAERTDWVKPGRAVWRYLDNAESFVGDPGADPGLPRATQPAQPAPLAPRAPRATTGSTTTRPTTRPRAVVSPDEAKHFSDLAAQLGWEYNILEGFWRRFSEQQLRDVVDHARRENVGIFVWVSSQSVRDPEARRRLFTMCRDVGIAGLKIDFFDHEHKEMIDLYQAILREAAENHLLLDFHGANKPTGEQRTWPNQLTREAVRGMESRSLPSRAAHEATLPFTRYLVGPAEYTPLIFGPRRGDSTWAHQIAVPATMNTPLLTYAAHPQKILESPAADLIKSIPSTWDETIVLPPSEIGELVVMARRKGETWFLAVLNGGKARQVQIRLSFLGEGEYHASLVRDVKDDPAAVNVEQTTLQQSDTLMIELNDGGGFLGRFTK